MPMIHGYARCSTLDQSVEGQIAALKKAGCTKVWSEKVSGAATRGDRPVFAKLITMLKRGDRLIVVRIDRLARSLRELVNVLHDLDQAGVGFKSLSDPWADTTSPSGKLMLGIVGSLAEYERSLIIARTSEGRERAKARGVVFGRKPKLSDFQRKEAIKRRGNGETLSAIAKTYGVSISLVSRL
jgi:DNA invertase Pin-like site-specific DNA recombinase